MTYHVLAEPASVHLNRADEFLDSAAIPGPLAVPAEQAGSTEDGTGRNVFWWSGGLSPTRCPATILSRASAQVKWPHHQQTRHAPTASLPGESRSWAVLRPFDHYTWPWDTLSWGCICNPAAPLPRALGFVES